MDMNLLNVTWKKILSGFKKEPGISFIRPNVDTIVMNDVHVGYARYDGANTTYTVNVDWGTTTATTGLWGYIGTTV